MAHYADRESPPPQAAGKRSRSRSLTLARIRFVHTAVTVRLGVSEEFVRFMAEELSDEDGCILVLGVTDEDWTPTFTERGVDPIRELNAEFSHLGLPLTTACPRPSPYAYA